MDQAAPPEHPPARSALLARTWPPLVGALVAVVLAKVASQPFRSYDTYFHLRFGAEFREGWALADPGQPSVASTNDWLPTQWLPQIGLSLVADRAGATGLMLLLAVALALFAAVVYLLVRSRAGAGASIVLTALVVLGCLPSLSLRPQLVSFLLAAVVIASWDLARRSGRVPWWLVAVSWLWAVSHGMWILGIVMSGVLALAVGKERGASRSEWLRLCAVPAGMLVAACLTPAGPRLLGAVLLVNSRADHFREWAAPELASAAAAPLTLVLAIAVLLAAVRGRAAPFDLGLLALGGVFAVYSGRTTPLALVALAPLVGAQVSALLERRRGAVRPPGRGELGLVAALAGLVVALAAAMPEAPEGGAADDLVAFDERLAALPAGTMVLTNRVYGGVLLWEQPHLDIPNHGYGDVYTDAELDAYDDMMDLAPGWDVTLRDLGATTAVLPEDEPIGYALGLQGWTVVDRSEEALLLVAPAGWEEP